MAGLDSDESADGGDARAGEKLGAGVRDQGAVNADQRIGKHLTGTVRLHDGDRWFDAGPGDFLHVAEGGVHGFRNESGEPASMLLLFAPGTPREVYFEGLAGLAGLTDEQRERFFLEHDTCWC